MCLLYVCPSTQSDGHDARKRQSEVIINESMLTQVTRVPFQNLSHFSILIDKLTNWKAIGR